MRLSEEPQFEIAPESRQMAEELFEAISGLPDPQEAIYAGIDGITRILRRGQRSIHTIMDHLATQIFGSCKGLDVLTRGAYIQDAEETEFAADVIALADALFFNPLNTDDVCVSLQNLMREALQETPTLVTGDFIERNVATVPDRCLRYAWLLVLGQSTRSEITQALINELFITAGDEKLTEYLITRCVVSQCENREGDDVSTLSAVKKLRSVLKRRKRTETVFPLTNEIFNRLSALPSESEQPKAI